MTNTTNIKPKIPDVYKNVADDASMNTSEVVKILGLTGEGFNSRLIRGQFPKCDHKRSTAKNNKKGAQSFWKMRTIRNYIRDFDKWMSGEMSDVSK